MKPLQTFYTVALFAIFGCINIHAQELHTESNAGSIANESNAITGWVPQNDNVTTVSVETSDVYGGSYAIRIETIAEAASRGKYIFTTTANTQYKIVIHAKSLSLDGGFWSWDGFSDFAGVDFYGTGWHRYEFNVTASGTSATLKVYAGAPSTIGEAVLIDNISIQELDSSPPTQPGQPTLVSKTSNSVFFNWTAAGDDIGVTGYKVYQNNVAVDTLSNVLEYTADQLTPSTPYQFHVTALDYYENESPASLFLDVTTDPAPAGGGNAEWAKNGTTASYSDEVAIGSNSVPSGYKLAVDGKLITEEVRVEFSGTWPDYVFEEGYDLPSLQEVQKHIDQHGHLPNIPSAEEVHANGMDVGEMNKLLLEKIEEMTLYIILLESTQKLHEKRLEQQNEKLAKITLFEKELEAQKVILEKFTTAKK
ncbi:fibronectin type III domain-containing protein [Flagellimonas sp.]|uniref:fibronectin type III domain-containing protein n=1 Tax=Flagellimonas sp. TaxID=2058762 RepID=UPI003BB1690C